MRKPLSRLTPVEIIVDLFIITAIFVAMVAAFIIVLQTYNAGTTAAQDQLPSSSSR